MAISCIVFASILGGIVFGKICRAKLPAAHLDPESRDVIKLGLGLIATMTALVLGLLVATAKSSFDTQQNGVAQLAGNVIMLDRVLARYGPETKEARELLRTSVTDMLQRTWPSENPPSSAPVEKSGTEGKYEGFYDKLEGLTPKNDQQRAMQTQALKIATDIGQTRWLLFAQRGSGVPTPLLVVMIFWLALIFLGFSLFAPSNATVIATLVTSALVISTAVFLILELDQPFGGVIQVSSGPLRSALEQLGR
jgi:hypothetical protein